MSSHLAMYSEIIEFLHTKKLVTFQGVHGSSYAYILARLVEQDCPSIVIISETADFGENLYEDLCFFLGFTRETAFDQGLWLLTGDESSLYSGNAKNPFTQMLKNSILLKLSQREPFKLLIILPVHLCSRTLNKKRLANISEYLVVKQTVDRENFFLRLERLGYNRVQNSLEEPGTFCVRGGIVDIFSPYYSSPYRLDFFGDEIDEIRKFDLNTGRSQKENALREDLCIPPVSEIIFGLPDQNIEHQLYQRASEQNIPTKKIQHALEKIEMGIRYFNIEALFPVFESQPNTFFDFLPDNTVFSYHNILSKDEIFKKFYGNLQKQYQKTLSSKQLYFEPKAYFVEEEEIFQKLANVSLIEHQEYYQSKTTPNFNFIFQDNHSVRRQLVADELRNHENPFLPLADWLKDQFSKKQTTFIVCSTLTQAERIKKILFPYGVHAYLVRTSFDLDSYDTNKFHKSGIQAYLIVGRLSEGFVFQQEHITFLSENDIFGHRLKKQIEKQKSQNATNLSDLKEKDFVIHANHGIGQYHGLSRISVQGIMNDFILLTYKDGDKLYMPVTTIDLLQRHHLTDEKVNIALDKLGGQTWRNSKQKIKDHLVQQAYELLHLYAQRKQEHGHAFSSSDDMYDQFVSLFPFTETKDQEESIAAVIKDMMKPQPMDRLICGDVGFGKTEVAMRAAMFAVKDKKQVAVLVPTTVLAQQHFTTFSERFKNFPVTVATLSRFQNSTEQRDIIAKANNGEIDILIGTHKLFTRALNFKDLGLLVIDEEHRFGVKQKENIKRMKPHIDILSLSATPLPRTLDMSLSGIRDISVITTPPVDRVAIQTTVHQFDETVIYTAIKKELERAGQVFFLHNHVHSIFAMAKYIENLLPEAKISVAHGQMPEEQLEEVMVHFVTRKTNVLVCTTIIESGIDIPSVNTLIVNRADRLGLAQLYQLRGRVGRSSEQAYALFLLPLNDMTAQAQKRIAVLQRFSELGSGFRIASHDLEIRGVGNLLGKEQSGHIKTIGYKLYSQLLSEALLEAKGEKKGIIDTEINIPIPAYLPDSYIKEVDVRIGMYSKFSTVSNIGEIDSLYEEFTEFYGKPPREVEYFARLMKIKFQIMRLGCTNFDFAKPVKHTPARFVAAFHDKYSRISVPLLVDLIQNKPEIFKLTQDNRVVYYFPALQYDDSDYVNIFSQAEIFIKYLQACSQIPVSDH